MASTACAACRMQRKKCSPECILAPYFPSSNPEKFAVAKKLFGTSHILQTLQRVPVEQRADAVNSKVYEASARFRDPIHGSGGNVNTLKRKISELESELAGKLEELDRMRMKRDNLMSLLFPAYDIGGAQMPIEEFMSQNVEPLRLWEF